MANPTTINVTEFDAQVYVVFRSGVPCGTRKYLGSALALAGEFGATGIHRTMEGVWESQPTNNEPIVFIYRMAVRP